MMQNMAVFKPTLREGIYVHREPCTAPTYVHIKESASSFTFTWHERTLERYQGTGWYEDCEQSGDWSPIVRMSEPTWMWTKPNPKGFWTFTIRKSGSQHAITLSDDGRTCWIAPYRNGGNVRFDWISDK